MRNNTHQAAKRAGFTLIELLVVIAIVAALAAILFPVFATVRERGRRTVCQSNLKQIGVAMQQYVQDNGGVYPPEVYQEKTTSPAALSAPVHWWQLVSPYAKTPQIFHCPSTPADSPRVFGTRNGSEVDYGYDWGRLNTITRKSFHGANEAALASPASIELNTDVGWVTPDDVCHYCRFVPKTSCGLGFTGSTLHSGGGNYSYIDGHVKWLTPEEAGEVECLNGPLPAPFKD